MMHQDKALVVLSGGQDSTTCLFWAKHHFQHVYAVTFDYGQRHRIELEAASKVARMAEVEDHLIVPVGKILVGSSPLVSQNPLAQYEKTTDLPGGLEDTFVPGRNLLFLTLAANLAYSLKILDVVTGVCQEDFGGYPDCRQKFIDAAQEAIREGLSSGPNDLFAEFLIHTPLMNLSKADSIHLARTLPGCWNALAYTHTAYDGQYPPIGRDHASVLREKGFIEAGLPDPLVLRAHREGLMELPKLPNYINQQLELFENED